MNSNPQNYQKQFISWLAGKVSPAEFSKLSPCYSTIEKFCLRAHVIRSPLFSAMDCYSAKRVQNTVTKNALFRIFHDRQMNEMISAAQYYVEFVEESCRSLEESTDDETGEDNLAAKSDGITGERVQTSGDGIQTSSAVDGAVYNAAEKPSSFVDSFYAYLHDSLKMAEGTCRSYTSALRSAEESAKQLGFSNYDICSGDAKSALAVTKALIENEDFLQQNESQHNRFSAAFKKLWAFCDSIDARATDKEYEERYPTVYSKLYSASKVYDDPAGIAITRICEIIGIDDACAIEDVLCHVSWATKTDDGVYSFSDSPEISCGFDAPQEPADFDKSRFVETLMRRYRNGMMFDSIDYENFRETYESLYDEKLPFDDSALEERLRYCGVLYMERLFPANGIIDPEAKEILYEYIDNSFARGAKVLYYKAIYEDLADAFANCYVLSDVGMLRAYIEFTAEKGKYYFSKNYLSTEKDVAIDHNTEIANYLLAEGKPARIDDVAAELSHIPRDQVRRIITTDEQFLRNAKGEYFHSDIFEISEDEQNAIAGIISARIDENEYAIWPDVWNVIQETMPSFLENNLYLSNLGIRNALAKQFIGRFNFNAAVISMPDDQLEMRDVYQLFAKHHPSFTADDIYNLSKELESTIYFSAIATVSVRVSHDLFVSRDQVSFDIDAIDKAIESFMARDYICIRQIDSYLAFPNVGFEWNEYLLESFVLSFSKKFMLLNNGMALGNVAGAIVKRDGAISDFSDVCAAIIAEEDVPLKKDAVLNRLAELNLITLRRYREIDQVLQGASQIRGRNR